MTEPGGWLRIGIAGILLLAITAVFLGMISGFLETLLLAAIFSAMAMPLYEVMLRWLGNRKVAAAALTLVVLILAILLPTLFLLGLIAGQAADLATQAVPWAQAVVTDLSDFQFELPKWVPFHDKIETLGPQIASKIASLAGEISQFLLGSLAAVTRGTAQFFLQLFVFLYAMFFFLMDGPSMVTRLIRTTTLDTESQLKILSQGYIVARATIKGSLLIGAIQGILGGVGFWITDIPNAALWGMVMAIASLIPSFGTAIVWVPGVIYLFMSGNTTMAVGLTVWSMILVGTIDNVLRPTLVGSGAKMSDFVILLSTLGGLATFGATGLILGPVIAAVFFTAWDVFAQANEPT